MVEAGVSRYAMKIITKQEVRRKRVGNVLASLRMEQLTPSYAVVQAMQACVSGHESTDNVIKQIVQRHVTLRRI